MARVACTSYCYEGPPRKKETAPCLLELRQWRCRDLNPVYMVRPIDGFPSTVRRVHSARDRQTDCGRNDALPSRAS
jgi:hypothetical protein